MKRLPRYSKQWKLGLKSTWSDISAICDLEKTTNLGNKGVYFKALLFIHHRKS